MLWWFLIYIDMYVVCTRLMCMTYAHIIYTHVYDVSLKILYNDHLDVSPTDDFNCEWHHFTTTFHYPVVKWLPLSQSVAIMSACHASKTFSSWGGCGSQFRSSGAQVLITLWIFGDRRWTRPLIWYVRSDVLCTLIYSSKMHTYTDMYHIISLRSLHVMWMNQSPIHTFDISSPFFSFWVIDWLMRDTLVHFGWFVIHFIRTWWALTPLKCWWLHWETRCKFCKLNFTGHIVL